MDANTTTTYPYWKIVAWRFIRGFFWGGITSMMSSYILLTTNLNNVKVWIFALTAAFLNGGFQSLGKIIRDIPQDNTALVQKLPI